MEILLLLLALGSGAYFFFKSNTKRGAETVRAYVYLGGLAAGASPAEANRVACLDVVNAPIDVIRGAMAAVKRDYDGKQLSMIGEAYRRGMLARSSNASSNEPAADASTPEWVMTFILYYVGWEMRIAGQGNLPDTVRALILGKMDGSQQQALLAGLQIFLSFAYQRNRQAGDYELVVKEAHNFLQAELRTINSPIAVRQFLRREHLKETGQKITDAELDTQFKEISDSVKHDDEAGFKLRNLLLADSMSAMFLSRQGKQIDKFSQELTAHFGGVT